MWHFTRRTAAPRSVPHLRLEHPAPLPRVLLPYDHDDDEDEYEGQPRRARARRSRLFRLSGIALLLLVAWLVLPPPVSDASPRVAAVVRESAAVASPAAAAFTPSDTIFSDTAFLSDSAIIAAAALIDAANAEADAEPDPKADSTAVRRPRESSATDAATQQLMQRRLAGLTGGARGSIEPPSSATDAATEQLTRQRLAGVISRSLPPIDSMLISVRGSARGPVQR